MKKKKSKAAPKAAKVRAKKVEIFRDYTEEDGHCFAYRKGAVTVTGFKRPFTAIRGVLCDLGAVTQPHGYPFNRMNRRLSLSWYTPKGQPIEILRSYIQPAKHKK